MNPRDNFLHDIESILSVGECHVLTEEEIEELYDFRVNTTSELSPDVPEPPEPRRRRGRRAQGHRPR